MKKSNFSEPQIIKILALRNKVNRYQRSVVSRALVRARFTSGRVSTLAWRFHKLNN